MALHFLRQIPSVQLNGLGDLARVVGLRLVLHLRGVLLDLQGLQFVALVLNDLHEVLNPAGSFSVDLLQLVNDLFRLLVVPDEKQDLLLQSVGAQNLSVLSSLAGSPLACLRLNAELLYDLSLVEVLVELVGELVDFPRDLRLHSLVSHEARDFHVEFLDQVSELVSNQNLALFDGVLLGELGHRLVGRFSVDVRLAGLQVALLGENRLLVSNVVHGVLALSSLWSEGDLGLCYGFPKKIFRLCAGFAVDALQQVVVQVLYVNQVLAKGFLYHYIYYILF